MSHSKIVDVSPGISIDEICDSLLKVVQMLQEEKTPASLRAMEAKLKKIPSIYSDFIPTWCDVNELDLLHHIIVNNFPEMVEFVLAECNWFPATHIPNANPYAHFAAIFGYTECLLQILKYRPSYYFSGTNHTLKLPPTIRKKIKHTDLFKKGVKRQINKLLDKIQSSVDSVETAIKEDRYVSADMDDVSTTLADELKALEASKREIDRSLKRVKNVEFSSKVTKVNKHKNREDIAFITLASEPLTKYNTKELGDSAKTCVGHEGSKDAKHGKYPKHIITVYSDEFYDDPQGVVQGAGEKVIVRFRGSAKKGRPGVSQPSGNIFKKRTRLSSVTSSQQMTPKQQEEKMKLATIQERRSRTDSGVILPKIVEPGVRGKGRYKDFELKIESRKVYPKDDAKSLRNKTPLSLAAEYSHLECVQMILETHILRNHPTTAVKEPLTLATKAKSPDTILFLMNQRISLHDYQSAVLTAIREMYPDCLTALLAQRNKERQSLFDGVNLYHVLYTQSLMAKYRYEMLPIMTNVLISSNEDVNAHNVPCTFPLYTLINCAFNISIGKKIFVYVTCLKILLENKANPHYDEEKEQKSSYSSLSFSRSAYSSAINCILDNAINSTNYFEHTGNSKLFMKKLIFTVTTCDKTVRRVLNDVLFNYMNTVCLLGIDVYIVRCLLRYGANPDFNSGKKYAINVYFDYIFPYLTRFEVDTSVSTHQQDITALMTLCRSMSYKCLKEAQIIFLNDNLMQCPIQALPLFRYFCHGLNELLVHPRSLKEIVAEQIWLRFRRNEKKVKLLPLPDPIISFILP